MRVRQHSVPQGDDLLKVLDVEMRVGFIHPVRRLNGLPDAGRPSPHGRLPGGVIAGAALGCVFGCQVDERYVWFSVATVVGPLRESAVVDLLQLESWASAWRFASRHMPLKPWPLSIT